MTRDVDYGDAVIRRRDDGTITVDRADPVIAVACALLEQLDPHHIDADGLLDLDTTGEYRYRPVRFAPDGIVVCERVTQ